MYPPNQPPKMRPRSSLSTHPPTTPPHQRHKPHGNNALLTLAGFCIFLFVLCAFLLGALIYVGKTLVVEQQQKQQQQLLQAVSMTATTTGVGNLTAGDFAANNGLLHSTQTKPILRFRTNPADTPTTILPELSDSQKNTAMAASKILSQLSYRLPRELRPRRYQLRLHPDLENKTFSGNVSIQLEVLQPISFIPVHSKLLTVTTEELVRIGEDGEEMDKITPSVSFQHTDYEYWVTEFAQPLQVGNYSLRLAFNGSLTDRIVGLYQSSYMDWDSGRRRWIATSKFEPTYARQAFPCFDEPSMKAMFTITLVRPTGDDYHALSNMNVESETVMGNNTEVHFAESVPMSTYLACFIVSDFAHKSKMVRGSLDGAKDIEMRVFSTAQQLSKVEYALETGVGIVEHYIKYFNVEYPLPKLDMAAIPDFVAGASEHWGLITYRETALLYDEAVSSSWNKQYVASVVAHELAHMWFGNLVTMKWWNDLWLNEGFASYIQYKGVNEVHPDWQMLDQFLIENLHGVMKLDATLASHPIVQVAESPNQISELFDSITYSKGASVIRMLEDLVGAEKFRNATTSYLNKFAFNNAETDDFLTEIEAQDFDFDVKLIMQTWTEQMGLPVVQVARDGNSYKLTQKRFFSNPADYNSSQEDSQFNYHWTIPITYFTSSAPEVQRVLFNYNDNELTVTVPSSVDWIKFNKNQVGYYRVNYPAEMWKELTDVLITNKDAFSISDRAHLISDVFALADASQLDYWTALNLTAYLQKEQDYVPWSVGTERLSAIKNLLYSTDHYRNFTLFTRELLRPVYEFVTWTVGGTHLQKLLRTDILQAACEFGYGPALQEAATQFSTWLTHPEQRPNPDIRTTVYYYGMEAAGNEQLWDQVWQLFLLEGNAQEKLKLMQSLSAIKEPWILQRYINLAWNESNVRGQDYFNCLQYISRNRIGQSLVWDYVRENWEGLVDRFGINERYLGRLIPGITRQFATQTKLEEMEAFFAKYPEAGAGTAARKEALETVKYNIKWLEQNKDQVGNWLVANRGQGDGNGNASVEASVNVTANASANGSDTSTGDGSANGSDNGSVNASANGTETSTGDGSGIAPDREQNQNRIN